VLLLNYPNNPTGAGLDWAAKESLAAFACRHDLLVISDEIYEEVNYAKRTPSLAGLPGMKDRTVLLNGMSKAFAMTGFRIGYACGPAAIIEAMMKVHQYSMLCASSIAQAAALEALQHGADERDAMCKEYMQRRNVMVKRLNDMGLTCFMPCGAFYAFPSIVSSGLDSTTFAKRLLQEKRVAVVPGPAFGASGEGHVRCAYATAMGDIERAMARIKEFLQELKSA
jgi:aminotransferase